MKMSLLTTTAAAMFALSLTAGGASAASKWDGADDLPTSPLACDAGGAAAAQLAGEVAEAVARPVAVDEHVVQLRASIGVSVYPDDGEDFAAMLRAAGRRMSARKPTRAR